MGERNRLIDYTWSSDDEQEMSHNFELSNRFNFPSTVNTSPTASSPQPSTSGQSCPISESLVDAFVAAEANLSLRNLSNTIRNETENMNRHHNRVTLRNRMNASNRLGTQHRTPSRSTSLASESRQNNNQHVKKMLILRKAALIDRRYWTSILKNLSIELIRRNSPQSTSTSNSRTGHGSNLPSTMSHDQINEEQAPNQQLSIHAPQSRVASADLALEEEVIEVVADDVNDNASANMANQSASGSQEDLSTLRTEQSANKSGRSRPLETPELTKVSEINQSLLRLLECPVCLEFMEPPMSQCRRGHLVCSSCRARIISCPICRTAFSSVRNRAMEAVSEIVRYPCRHGCGRETRLRRRETHEANCANRTYSCPVVSCSEHTRYPHSELQLHYQDKHSSLLRQGETQTFTLKLNQEHNEQWLLKAHNELFHVGIDITMNSWSLFLYVIYVGPKRKARNYTYEVTVVGNYNDRKMIYSRATHSDLENNSFNVGRHDCFYLSLDQAMNYIRFKNKYCDPKGELNINLSLLCNNTETHENSDICVD